MASLNSPNPTLAEMARDLSYDPTKAVAEEMASMRSDMDRLEDLLMEACSIINSNELPPNTKVSDELRDWWKLHRKKTLEEQARSVLLSVPDSDVEILDAYITKVRDSAAGQHITNILGRLRV